MTAFLTRVSIALLEQYSEIHRVGIIVPSKRAERVLRQAILEEITTPVLSPAIFTIEEVMADLSGLGVANSMDQLIILYDSYEKLNEGFSDSLDDFLKWAPAVLRDFDEIHRFGVDSKKIFKEMQEIESLEQWGLDEPTDLMNRRLVLWRQLPGLFSLYNEKLDERKLGSAGHIFNRASPSKKGPTQENFNNWMLQKEIDHLVFVGFNALTPPEISLFKSAYEYYGATAFWDIDAHYINNLSSEAGHYLRKNIKNLPAKMVSEIVNPPANFLTSQISFSIIRANGNIALAKVIGGILNNKHLIANNFNKCAVILADEELLIPTLQALPPEIQEANVTMGMALNSTVTYSSIDLLLQLQEAKEISGKYPLPLLEATFSDPICCAMRNASDGLNMESQIHNLRYSKKGYWSVSDTVNLIGENPDLWEEYPNYIYYIKNLRKRLFDYSGKITSGWEIEPAKLCIQALDRLINWTKREDLKFRTLRQLFRYFSKESPVNFYGEPFGGLQIMGLLETRNLDFDTVILAPCNEGILPGRRSSTSFLSNDLRKAYKIPILREQEAIIAYHTYRLVQRAKKVFFLVNTGSDGLNSSEASRFLQQMEIELSRYSGIKWEDIDLELKLDAKTIKGERSIYKYPLIIERTLKRLKEKGMSPSSGSTYIKNPYKFYLQYVLGIKEEETHSDRLPANIRGNILHDLHQDLYEYYKSNNNWNLSKIENSLNLSISRHFPIQSDSGPFHLERKVIEKIAYDWSREEAKRIQDLNNTGKNWQVHLVEEYLESHLTLNNGDTIKIRGKADRVEKWENYWVIVDLKTGTFQNDQINFKEWGDLLNSKKKKEKAFQLMTYAWLLSKQEKRNPSMKFKAGISSMRHPSKPVAYIKWQKSDSLTFQELEDFETFVLIPLVEEILNPEICFIDTLEI